MSRDIRGLIYSVLPELVALGLLPTTAPAIAIH